jgi:hypothetical protein
MYLSSNRRCGKLSMVRLRETTALMDLNFLAVALMGGCGLCRRRRFVLGSDTYPAVAK